MSGGRSGGGGYTLVELVVVLAIMALAAVVVAPALFRPEAQGNERVIRTLAEANAEASNAAVAVGGDAEVWLNTLDGRWVSLLRPGGSAAWDTLGSGSVSAPGVRLEAAGAPWAVFRFDARGRASGPAVTAHGTDGMATLRPDPWTGRLHVAHR